MCSYMPLVVNRPVWGGSCNHGICSVIFSPASLFYHGILSIGSQELSLNKQFSIQTFSPAQG